MAIDAIGNQFIAKLTDGITGDAGKDWTNAEWSTLVQGQLFHCPFQNVSFNAN